MIPVLDVWLERWLVEANDLSEMELEWELPTNTDTVLEKPWKS